MNSSTHLSEHPKEEIVPRPPPSRTDSALRNISDSTSKTPGNAKTSEQDSNNLLKPHQPQETELHKMVEQLKGQNYFMGQTQPICFMKVRPLFIHESIVSNRQMVEVLDRESLVFATSEGSTKDDLINLTRDKLYRSDRIVPQDQPNGALFNLQFPDIIDSLLQGISHAAFAIGAESSGKTHSLYGTLSDPGLILFFAQHLFKKKQTQSSISIYFSMMKFDDDFEDLFCPTGQTLSFKQTRLGCLMPCLTQVKIETLKEFFVYFRIALRSLPGKDINREMGSGSLQIMERNHSICKFKIVHKVLERQINKKKTEGTILIEEKIEQKVYESNMIFVDCDHYDMNEKMDKKGLSLSLLALENIMQYVYEINKGFRSSHTHIPYDQSKFTNYFKNYLYGHHQIIFIGTLSPFRDHLEVSTKTARLIQWAFNSKNSVFPKITTGIQAYTKVPFKEVGFIKKIHVQSNILGDELKLYLSNLYIKHEEKVRYVGQMQQILKDQKLLLSKNVRQIRLLFQLRDSLIQMKTEFMKNEFDAVKYCVKTADIRELYLIRSFPHATGLVQKQLESLQANIIKRSKEINQSLNHLLDIKSKFKELIEVQMENYKNTLKINHLHALQEFSDGLKEFLRWSQDNAIRSCEAHDSYRMDIWMEEVTTKIFSFLEHIIKQMDIQEYQNRKKLKTLARIPSEMSLRSLGSIMLPGSMSDIKLFNMNSIINTPDDDKVKKGVPLKLSDFDLPSIAQHGKLLTFQFQRDSQGKYAPFTSAGTLAISEPFQKISNKKSSVMDAFESLLSITSDGMLREEKREAEREAEKEGKHYKSNSSVPSILHSQPSSILKIAATNKSLFFGGNNIQNLKPGEEKRGIKISTFERVHDQSELSIEQSSSGSNLKLPEETNGANKVKKITLKRVTSFELESKQNSQNNAKNISQADKDLNAYDEEEQDEITEGDNNNPKRGRKKYSIEDLQRINNELKEKKAKMKEDHEKIVLEAEQEITKLHQTLDDEHIMNVLTSQESSQVQKNDSPSKRNSLAEIINRSRNLSQQFSQHEVQKSQLGGDLSQIQTFSRPTEITENIEMKVAADKRYSVAAELLAMTKKQPPLLQLRVKKNSVQLKSKIHLDDSFPSSCEHLDMAEQQQQLGPIVSKQRLSLADLKPQQRHNLQILDQITGLTPKRQQYCVSPQLPSIHNTNKLNQGIFYRPKMNQINLNKGYLNNISRQSQGQDQLILGQSFKKLGTEQQNSQIKPQSFTQSTDIIDNRPIESQPNLSFQHRNQKRKNASTHEAMMNPSELGDIKSLHPSKKLSIFTPTFVTPLGAHSNEIDMQALLALKKQNKSLQGSIKSMLVSASEL